LKAVTDGVTAESADNEAFPASETNCCKNGCIDDDREQQNGVNPFQKKRDFGIGIVVQVLCPGE
jgi:hypothetical protein